MTRDVIPLSIADLSVFTQSLRQELAKNSETPGHLALMNMIARAAGFKNLQHVRAIQSAEGRLTAEAPEAPDMAMVETVLRHFDADGNLIRWPAKTAHQRLAVRALWARLPQHISMTEREVSDRLNNCHHFKDAAILRRTMVELGLITRSDDCRDYRRAEKPPTSEARLLIGLLSKRQPSVRV